MNRENERNVPWLNTLIVILGSNAADCFEVQSEMSVGDVS
jgi:hypothetical protein